MKALTIFTPSYNRAHLLPRIYTCLKDQTCQDFIWLIIDDGSVDDTRQVVTAFIQEDTIEIQYIYQENQGMHGAHNTAYENIITPLNTCIDSDDCMPIDAVGKILRKWEMVENKEKYSGLVGLDADLKGNLIGSRFRTETTTLEDFYLQGGTGDKKLVYRTAVMQQYPPYPLFPGEKYVGLGYKYQLADQDFELVTLNEILVLVDYQAGGSSNNMFRQYYNNPRGFAFIRKQGMVMSKSPVKRFKDAVHYVSSSLLSGNRKFIAESPRKAMTVLAFPLGLVLYAIVLFKNRGAIDTSEL
ncbi:glycosyltransferase [Chryseobacterium gotjawalense]|uniref:Glycosyltransferase n=1 Tax=Chryseobacterium gotjawalense TaxID=3042315 RepID=A0ABY8REK5_9FLAO|nr:glycosyltransferase [Chryseobacterium sp. wdc7]WHF51444.1 glycosyltransferase [Chryseobacterium sp. wdc7]